MTPVLQEEGHNYFKAINKKINNIKNQTNKGKIIAILNISSVCLSQDFL
jgi:hypothetical protein